MRLRATVLIIGVAAVVTSGALATPAVRDAYSLTLRPADVPGATGTRLRSGAAAAALRAIRVRGNVATYAYHFKSGSLEGTQVAGGVYAVASASQARTTFAALKRELLRQGPRNVVRLSTAYGDQQFAVLLDPVAKVLVRKNTVVWQLEIDAFGAVASVDERAELQKYALKQRARVGRG